VDSTVLYASGTVLVGIASAGAAYFAARRTTRGTVNTSEAADLWAESNAMRRELREEVVALRAQVLTLQKKMDDCVDVAEGLRKELIDVRRLLTSQGGSP
jgi:hypothetical protein